MANITIRRLTGDEQLEARFALGMYAFRATPPYPDKEEWMERTRDREGVTYIAAFDGDKPLSGGASSAMTVCLRGKLFQSHGIFAVATDPAARRQGLARQIMSELLSDSREAGHAFSHLYPFRESFYQRMGYVTFPLSRIACFNATAMAPLLGLDCNGTVERVLLGDGILEFRELLERMQERTHGMGLYNLWDKRVPWFKNNWLALARSQGETVGAMVYQITGTELAGFEMKVQRFLYLSAAGKYLLLQWIARHGDQVGPVEIELPAYEYPETWLEDLQVSYKSASPAPMGRVLDVSQMGGMQTGPGSFTARILDPLCPWNEGTWEFATVEGKLEVGQTEHADTTLSVQGLSALVYGLHDPADFELRGWGNPSPEVQATMRSMFPPMIPYLCEDS